MDWPEPLDLPSSTPSAPVMGADLLPPALEPWIMDASERLSVHPEMVAIPAMVAAAASVGRTLGIYPRAYDEGWVEASNLWGAVVAPPSSRKTPAINEGLSHFRHLQSRLLDDYRVDQAQRDAKAEVIEVEINNLKNLARRKGGTTAGLEEALLEKRTELEEQKISEPRLFVNDTTIEKLGELLAENSRGLLYVRDELTGLLKSTEKPGHENDRPFLLEAWNGTGSYSFDRIGRGTLHVPSLNLSLVGGIQPGKLKPYVNGAITGSSDADGLLQRFQLLVWQDRGPDRKRVDRLANAVAARRALAVYETLLQIDPSAVGAFAVQEGRIPALHFSDGAQQLFDSWYDEHNELVQSDELMEAPAFQGHLVKYMSLVPRLSLVFHLIAIADGKTASAVSEAATARAIRWAGFLKGHAEKVYANELNGDVRRAIELGELIRLGEIGDGSRVPEIYKGRQLGAAEDVFRSLALLERRHWLRVEERANPGARSSKFIRLSPKLALY
jgi:hypothetical protein